MERTTLEVERPWQNCHIGTPAHMERTTGERGTSERRGRREEKRELQFWGFTATTITSTSTAEAVRVGRAWTPGKVSTVE
jgi:hypothetical protein